MVSQLPQTAEGSEGAEGALEPAVDLPNVVDTNRLQVFCSLLFQRIQYNIRKDHPSIIIHHKRVFWQANFFI
jgi:hypothetical protein